MVIQIFGRVVQGVKTVCSRLSIYGHGLRSLQLEMRSRQE